MKRFLSAAILVFLVQCNLIAQPTTIALTESHILGRVDYQQAHAAGDHYRRWLFSAGWRPAGGRYMSMLKSNTSVFTHTTLSGATLPSSFVSFKLHSISNHTPGSSNLPSSPLDYQTLGTTFKPYLDPPSQNSASTSGIVLMNYKISDYSNVQLHAGRYTIDILNNQIYNLFDFYHYTTPNDWQMYIDVPVLCKWTNTPAAITRTLELSDFSSNEDLILDLSGMEAGHTVGAIVDIRGSGPISYRSPTGFTGTVALNNVQATGAGLSNRQLTTAFQQLTATGFSVAAGNRSMVPLQLRIPATNLNNNFYNPGTYTFNVDVRVRNANTSVVDIKTIPVTITTNTLNNISIQGSPDITFTFASPADYQLGKSQNMPNHLLISNSRSYEVYVKSGSSFFTLNGVPSAIPASILQIENGAGETAVITRSLSTTPQAILSNAPPVVNRNVSIQYKIPPEKTGLLFGRTTGNTPYLLTVIYSFTNQ